MSHDSKKNRFGILKWEEKKNDSCSVKEEKKGSLMKGCKFLGKCA